MRNKDLKKIGIIGGVGPKASSIFYDLIVDHIQAECDQDHPDIVVLSYASIPDRTEAILSGDGSRIIPTLCRCVRELDSLGCELIAIPCNTAHYYYDEMSAAADVRIINMIELAVGEAAARGAHRLGIMATEGTVAADVYGKACEAAGLEVCYPEEGQADVNSLIYDDVKQGKTGDKAKFERAYDELKSRGCDAIILACTELSVFAAYNDLPEDVLDAMDALVRETIELSGAVFR